MSTSGVPLLGTVGSRDREFLSPWAKEEDVGDGNEGGVSLSDESEGDGTE